MLQNKVFSRFICLDHDKYYMWMIPNEYKEHLNCTFLYLESLDMFDSGEVIYSNIRKVEAK